MKENKTLIADPKELNGIINEVEDTAINAIMDYMKRNNITELDLTKDKNGLTEDNEDFDFDWVFDNRVYVTCYDKYGATNGYVTKVTLNNDKLSLEAYSDEEDCDYSEYDMNTNVTTYIRILYFIKELTSM